MEGSRLIISLGMSFSLVSGALAADVRTPATTRATTQRTAIEERAYKVKLFEDFFVRMNLDDMAMDAFRKLIADMTIPNREKSLLHDELEAELPALRHSLAELTSADLTVAEAEDALRNPENPNLNRAQKKALMLTRGPEMKRVLLKHLLAAMQRTVDKTQRNPSGSSPTHK